MIVDGKIKCSRCKIFKELKNFQPGVVKRKSGRCKVCLHIERKERYRKNPQPFKDARKRYVDKVGKAKVSEWNKNRYKGKPDVLKKYNLIRYGLSLTRFKEMEHAQGNKCLICKEVKKLFVDHCHATGKIRGLLCGKCNSGIGMLGDNLQRVESAVRYLKGEI